MNPLIDYIPSVGEIRHWEQILPFLQAQFPLLDVDQKEEAAAGYEFVKYLASLEEERWDCLGEPSLAIASNRELSEAIYFFTYALYHLISFGGLLRKELEAREKARTNQE
jgi:hypothetical protein